MATARIAAPKQTLDDAYAPPANFLEIDISKPKIHGFGNKRFCDYEVRMKTNLETCHHQAYIVAKTKFEHLKARYTFIVDDVINYNVIIIYDVIIT